MTPEMERGSYFTRVRSASKRHFMPIGAPLLTVLPPHLFSSVLVLNHDWLPERRYDMGNSWVGKIIDIRGNSPRNVRSSRSFCGAAHSLIAIGRSG